MEQGFQLLQGNDWLIPLVAVGALVVVALILTGFLQGREISFWPPRIGQRPPGIGPSSPPDSVPAHSDSNDAVKRLDGNSPIWLTNSREAEDRVKWRETSILVIGVQYSPKFFRDHFDIIQHRSQTRRMTIALVLEPRGAAAQYLKDTGTGMANITECVQEIECLLKEADNNRGYVSLKKHDRIMRYSFIRTESDIWVKFFTNAPYRTLVPAVKICAGQVPFEFFEEDVRRLEEVAHEG